MVAFYQRQNKVLPHKSASGEQDTLLLFTQGSAAANYPPDVG